MGAFYCGSDEFGGHKITSNDWADSLAQRFGVSFNYGARTQVMWARDCLSRWPGPGIEWCSKWGYWGNTLDYADYTLADITAMAYPGEDPSQTLQ